MELLPGVTGYAKVECGKRKVYEVALRRLWRYWRTEVWTWY
jgi:hypothetical protein